MSSLLKILDIEGSDLEDLSIGHGFGTWSWWSISEFTQTSMRASTILSGEFVRVWHFGLIDPTRIRDPNKVKEFYLRELVSYHGFFKHCRNLYTSGWQRGCSAGIVGDGYATLWQNGPDSPIIHDMLIGDEQGLGICGGGWRAVPWEVSHLEPLGVLYD